MLILRLQLLVLLLNIATVIMFLLPWLLNMRTPLAWSCLTVMLRQILTLQQMKHLIILLLLREVWTASMYMLTLKMLAILFTNWLEDSLLTHCLRLLLFPVILNIVLAALLNRLLLAPWLLGIQQQLVLNIGWLTLLLILREHLLLLLWILRIMVNTYSSLLQIIVVPRFPIRCDSQFILLRLLLWLWQFLLLHSVLVKLLNWVTLLLLTILQLQLLILLIPWVVLPIRLALRLLMLTMVKL